MSGEPCFPIGKAQARENEAQLRLYHQGTPRRRISLDSTARFARGFVGARRRTTACSARHASNGTPPSTLGSAVVGVPQGQRGRGYHDRPRAMRVGELRVATSISRLPRGVLARRTSCPIPFHSFPRHGPICTRPVGFATTYGFPLPLRPLATAENSPPPAILSSWAEDHPKGSIVCG